MSPRCRSCETAGDRCFFYSISGSLQSLHHTSRNQGRIYVVPATPGQLSHRSTGAIRGGPCHTTVDVPGYNDSMSEQANSVTSADMTEFYGFAVIFVSETTSWKHSQRRPSRSYAAQCKSCRKIYLLRQLRWQHFCTSNNWSKLDFE